MKNSICFILFLILSFSTNAQEKIKFKKEADIKGEIIIHDIPAMGIGEILFTDSLFITQDIRAKEDFMLIYNYKNQHLLAQFGKTGRGPGEMITPSLNSISDDGRRFILYDPNFKKMHFCNLNDFNDKPVHTIKFNATEMKRIFKTRLLNENKVLGMGMLQDNLFALIDLETNKVTQHGKLPFKPKNAGNNFYWELNSGSIFLTPDKKHLIFTAMYFGYIACYKIENEAFSLEWEHWITDVKYTMSNGRIYFKNDNLIGFMNAAVTNEKIYAIYHGEGMHAMRADDPNQPKTIMVFSIKGEPLAKYRTDYPILRIGLNPQGEVFCVSNPLTYDLVKFDIK